MFKHPFFIPSFLSSIMTEDSQSSPSNDLDKAKALLDAFETISDTGQTTRSGQSAREAPMPAPKSPSVRETPTAGIARVSDGVMAHQEGVQSVREAPVDLNHKIVHEAPENLGYAGTSPVQNTPLPSSNNSIPLPGSKEEKDSE
ncbi:MAG TPA: hypothetical protein D7H86_04010 [Candidatus Poseidoniales archaeon]|nr:MAG TPA: hypothetical protein D7H86_04010 [Candidatus Poseidoniales archaeon]|tara:strand:- start:273 stop:704 length:432 start_codon:yes stop_codon:yes gene_type:complete